MHVYVRDIFGRLYEAGIVMERPKCGSSYLAAMTLTLHCAAKELMRNFEEQFEDCFLAYLSCSHINLTPYQLGLLAAAQVPRLPLHHLLKRNKYPLHWIGCPFRA